MPTADSPRSSKGRAPNRRNEEARLAVLHAADDLLVERGFGGVTIEGIAARAGVAKQTIYRWWPSKVDVLLETLVEDANRQLAIPDGDSAVENARAYLRRLARFVSKDDAGKVLLALIGEAQHDAETARLFKDRYLDPQRNREREMLSLGVSAGELPGVLDVVAALVSLCGPIFWRALTGKKVPRAFIDELVGTVLE